MKYTITQEMIRAGATRFVVAGNFPIGCFPFVVAIFAGNGSTAYDELGCARSANELAIFQNNNLKATLASLRKEFPGVSIIYADFYNAFLSIFRLAPLYGTLLSVIYYYYKSGDRFEYCSYLTNLIN